MYVGGAGACLFAVAFPTSAGMATEPKIAVAAVSLAGSLTVVALGRRLTRPLLYAGGCAANLLVTLLVAEADTAYGSTVAAFGYLWVSLYSGLFFSLPAVVVQVLLAASGMGAALAVAEHPNASSAWIVASVTALAFGTLPHLLSRQLRAEARTDPLTGLLNRRGLDGVTRSSYLRADACGDTVTIAFFDLDHFKLVNDEHGHDAGDRLLTLTAQAIRRHFPAAAPVARVGGDEFVASIPNARIEEVEAIVATIAKEAPTAFSVGLCERRPGESLASIMQRASWTMRQRRRDARRSAGAPRLGGALASRT
jgi:diguanylate cyclase (GGDEF)-like protein